MSVYSMTGYASTSANRVDAHSQPAVPDAPTPRSTPDSSASVTVELRSVNGRFLDLSLRLPDELRSLEPALRELVGSSFRRGKIELRLSTQTSSSTPWPQPQPEQLNRLSHLQGTVRGWLPQARELSVHEVLQWCKDASGPEQRRAWRGGWLAASKGSRRTTHGRCAARAGGPLARAGRTS